MSGEGKSEEVKPVVGLYGLAVMGQNLALNIASKGFPIAVCNRSPEKIDVTVQRAKDEGNLPLVGYKELAAFVEALEKPRKVIILVQAGKPVDAVINQLAEFMEVRANTMRRWRCCACAASLTTMPPRALRRVPSRLAILSLTVATSGSRTRCAAAKSSRPRACGSWAWVSAAARRGLATDPA